MILIVSSKKVYAAKRIAQECRVKDVECRVMDVQELMDCGFKVAVNGFDVFYVRDPYLKGSPRYIPHIIKLAKNFKAAGKRVVDSLVADGHLGQGKWLDYKKLKQANLPIPITSQNHGRDLNKYIYPFVLKWVYGFGGKNVFLIKNQKQLGKILPLHPKKEWLIQEYVNADYEFEVYVVGFKAVAAALAYKINDGFKANVKKSIIIRSAADHPEYNKLLKIASQAAKALGRELCKVDILEKNGKFYILEVNRNPGLVSFESLIGYNMASEFVNYLIKKGKL